MLNLEIHPLEDRPLSLLVLLLRKAFVGISLITVQVGYILIQLPGLSRNYQARTRPELLVSIQFV